MPLQVRLTLIMGLVTALVLAVAVGFVVVRQDAALRQTAMSSGAAMTSFVATNAALTAADNATLPSGQQDWLPIQAFVHAASLEKNVVGVVVSGPDGVVHGASDPQLVSSRYTPPTNDKFVQSSDDIRISTYEDPHAGATFRFVKPISYAGRVVGQVDVTLSRKELEAAGALTRSLLIALGFLVSAVVAGATYFGTRMIARPLRQLRKALDDAAGGNLDFRISHNRTDEFGELFDAFNRLCTAVQDQLQNVEAIALEQPVETTAARPAAPPKPAPKPTSRVFEKPAAETAPEASDLVQPKPIAPTPFDAIPTPAPTPQALEGEVAVEPAAPQQGADSDRTMIRTRTDDAEV